MEEIERIAFDPAIQRLAILAVAMFLGFCCGFVLGSAINEKD